MAIDRSHSPTAFDARTQEQIDSAAAGVMFCQNPFTQNKAQFMINATWGQGHGVVEGELPCDEFLVAAATGAVVRSTVAEKSECWGCKPSGGIELRKVGAERATAPSLSTAQISRLASFGRLISAAYVAALCSPLSFSLSASL